MPFIDRAERSAPLRGRLLVALLAVLILFGPAPRGTSAGRGDLVEPGAGGWKTWAIPSGSALRLPAPPDRRASRDELRQLRALAAERPAALDRIAYWTTSAPAYRWNEIAVNAMLRRNLGSPVAARHLALVHVAIYDATVAAWDSKYAYNRARPATLDPTFSTAVATPRSPAYPSEHAVAASAAAAVLSYLFPDEVNAFTAQAEEAGRTLLLAGVQFPSDVQAGNELGRAVAVRVVERAKADGFDAKWTGSVPTTPGSWSGTNPVAPMAGTWKPWALAASNELRPGPPHVWNGPQLAAEMAEVRAAVQAITPKQRADAFFWEYSAGGARNYAYWNAHVGRNVLEYNLDDNPPQVARAYALESIAYYDSMVACWDAKYAYWALRPFQLDPSFTPIFATPGHPSYPSAHSCFSKAAATVLAHLFPRDAASLQGLADAAGESRIYAGIHFRSDVTVGRDLGWAVARRVIERAGLAGAGH